ncbi:hypothetical protein [Undibacterium sp.]|uniref:hypothetical protein n=1 Tax=Undibacterium sp. TaxID=1914977 RepID=UPI00374DDB60
MISLKTFSHLNLVLTLMALLGIPLLFRHKPHLRISCAVFSMIVMFMFVCGLPPQVPLQERLMHGAIQIAFDLLLGFACAWLLQFLSATAAGRRGITFNDTPIQIPYFPVHATVSTLALQQISKGVEEALQLGAGLADVLTKRICHSGPYSKLPLNIQFV